MSGWCHYGLPGYFPKHASLTRNKKSLRSHGLSITWKSLIKLLSLKAFSTSNPISDRPSFGAMNQLHVRKYSRRWHREKPWKTLANLSPAMLHAVSLRTGSQPCWDQCWLSPDRPPSSVRRKIKTPHANDGEADIRVGFYKNPGWGGRETPLKWSMAKRPLGVFLFRFWRDWKGHSSYAGKPLIWCILDVFWHPEFTSSQGYFRIFPLSARGFQLPASRGTSQMDSNALHGQIDFTLMGTVHHNSFEIYTLHSLKSSKWILIGYTRWFVIICNHLSSFQICSYLFVLGVFPGSASKFSPGSQLRNP